MNGYGYGIGISFISNRRDPVTNQYLAQLSTPPSGDYIKALDTFIKGLRSDGNLTVLDRMWIFACEIQQHARVSIINPTSSNITEVNSPTWTANQGYTGNGSTSYLNSNFAPSVDGVNYTRDLACYGTYSRSNVQSTGSNMGLSGASSMQSITFERFTDDNFYVSINGTGQGNVANTDSRGLFAAARVVSTHEEGWKNGSRVVNYSGAGAASVALQNVKFYISARNNNGTAANFSTRQIAMAFIGGNVGQANFYTRFQTFATTRGFNV